MQRMLVTAVAAAAFSVLVPSASDAIEYPWCAQYGGPGGDGGRNCGFTTFAQCMATVSGVGGFCERNLFYRGPERPHKPRRKRSPDDLRR
ncbi:MAG: DUF3551 domain-containing protein [Pseudolabrys sp.]|nr:DUF3551 domain-containing protein [Pseudolabrys sp.]